MKRKLIIVITVLSLLFSIIPFGSVAAGAVAQTTFSVESVTMQENSSIVDVRIIVQNNVGIAGATLNFAFADGLTLISATNGEAFSNLVYLNILFLLFYTIYNNTSKPFLNECKYFPHQK